MEKQIQAKISFIDGKEILLNLYPQYAPLSVDNFVKLCKEGFYNGLCFHRIIDNFMIQGGGFLVTKDGLIQKQAKPIKGEFISNGVQNTLSHKKGVISMARTNDPNSASSQFFICVADALYLDGQYAAFGECADEQSLNTVVTLGKVKT